ncbi:hypothetical protein O6H91_21G063100 [Diphasiastrum complanatum]|uniref:Uncharacterized protein n=1 Tax=Diphasiastrum complanatum TaxID=34168 RepID=A0ACC2ALH0_DIPCM|nr:hypothetical protein O6H91_21G063100 [Diphasiastrum complanatum]
MVICRPIRRALYSAVLFVNPFPNRTPILASSVPLGFYNIAPMAPSLFECLQAPSTFNVYVPSSWVSSISQQQSFCIFLDFMNFCFGFSHPSVQRICTRSLRTILIL